MGKKRKSKAFWNNIKFKYKLTIINENTLEEVAGLHVSKLNGISVLLTALLVVFVATSAVIAFTPLRNYLPGYMNSEVREQVVRNALQADSLQEALQRYHLYVLNIQDILGGKVRADSVHSMDSLTNLRTDSLMARTQAEDDFRHQYEDNEKYNLTTLGETRQAEGLVFFRPTRGMVSAHFDTHTRHFGTDVAAKQGESIVAALDGTVVISTYTADAGYVVGIQHNQDFITFYKHCGSTLKEIGDKVKAGEAVALVGTTPEGSTRPHLHFELWRKGRPVDPEKYILF
ncbi:MAG: M23 family metallopeptidase [Bacteroidaceae bacterium]